MKTCCTHDCDQGRAYPNHLHRRRSTDEPAEAETRPPVDYPFAPGSIEGPTAARLSIWRILGQLALLSIVIAALGFVGLYAATKWLWPL